MALIALGIVLIILIFALYLLSQGAIYVPTHENKIQIMLDLAAVKPGELAADLGSGDGRIVIALAAAGAVAHGFEINPVLVWRSRRKIRALDLQDRAFIHFKSFWPVDLSQFSIVTVFGIDHIMSRLERKLRRELPRDARVISFLFKFPSWPASREQSGTRLYLAS